MLCIVWRAGFVCLLAGALVVGATLLGVLHPRPLAADEGEPVRLLVKCDRDELTKVLAALAETQAEVWDLATMKRLSAVTPRPPPKASPAPRAPGAIEPLRDAGRVMAEVYRALGSTPRAQLGKHFQIEEMAIKPRRASIGVVVDSHASVGLVRKALAASAWFSARGAQVSMGAAQRVGALIRQKLYVTFDASRPEPGQAVHLTQLDAQAFERVMQKHRLTFAFASAVQQDPNRKAGYVTTAREYTFRAATLGQLQAFLVDLPSAQPGLVAFEVRWKVSGGTIPKPVVRVGGRAPVGP